MTMEILLEPISNKLLVGDLCDSLWIKLVTTGKKRWCDSILIKLVPDSILQARNHVKEILLNLNLPDHRSILMDSKIHIKMVWGYEVLKLKNIKKDGYTNFQHQEQYEHDGSKVTSAQEGKRSQDDDKRLCLVDDLKKLKITFMSSQRYKSKPKVNDHYIHSQVND
ncbi:hypothetical protein Tco_0548467 [Tanacetum coccineum]